MTGASVALRVRVQRSSSSGGAQRLAAKVQGNAGSLAYHYAQRTVGYVQRYAPIRTGRLRQSAKYHRMGKYHFGIEVGAPYAVYVNYGTRYMHAQPFWEPALRFAKAAYDEEKKKVFQ